MNSMMKVQDDEDDDDGDGDGGDGYHDDLLTSLCIPPSLKSFPSLPPSLPPSYPFLNHLYISILKYLNSSHPYHIHTICPSDIQREQDLTAQETGTYQQRDTKSYASN